MFNVINVDDKQVFLDSSVLFTRLTAIAQREDDVEKYFKFEMSPYLPSLFKDAVMHNPDKPTLRKVLLKDEDRVNVDTVVPSSYVLDGRALFHQLRWLKGSTYKDLTQSYVSYVCHHYNTATIVFDGYSNPLSMKTNARTRRSAIRCQDVVINESNIFNSTQPSSLQQKQQDKYYYT